MTREELIITEAKKRYYDDINCINAFFHGVCWAELHPANVWHDASEIPDNHNYIMFLVDRYTIKTDYVPACLNRCQLNGDNWNEFVKDANIKQWAYIDDLLPKTNEK